ncbi:MAG TPA: hypothetical protein VF352_08885 [Anaerolineales bacterium]
MFAFRSLVRARSEMGESLYGLERETARRHTSQAIAALSLIVFLAIAELVLTVFLAPNLPALFLLVTPTINPLTTPTYTIPPELLATIGVLTPEATPTAQTTGCIPGQIMITSPKPGDVIKDQVTLVGTANIPNFGFYKYEFSSSGTDVWSTIGADRKVKVTQDGELGHWDTSEVTPGDYNLRLVVLDNQGNPLPPCVVPVRVAAP